MFSHTFIKDVNSLVDEKVNIQSLQSVAEYYKEYYKENFTNFDFLVKYNKKVVGCVLCAAFNNTISLPDTGVIIHLFDLSSKGEKLAYSYILEILEKIAANNSCKIIMIKDQLNEGNLSILGECLFNQRFQSRLTFEMIVDYLSFSESILHKNIRKSYKSLINWGRKNLEISYVNEDLPSFENFKQLQEFHFKIAGKKTRSDETWKIQYDLISKGFGELVLAKFNNELVGGSLFIDCGNTSIYFTGVYERSLFQFGLSHYLLYHGICRSYERKNTQRFSLGYFDTNIKDQKWYDIQFFKKGFTKNLTPTILWSKET